MKQPQFQLAPRAIGSAGPVLPLEVKVLACLRLLAGGPSFQGLRLVHLAPKTIHSFFHRWVAWFALHYWSVKVAIPETAETLQDKLNMFRPET